MGFIFLIMRSSGGSEYQMYTCIVLSESLNSNDRLIGYLEAVAEELVVEELVDDQYLAEDDEEVGGLAGVE